MGSRKTEMGNFAAENEPAVRRMASPENPTRPDNGAFLSQGSCWKATPCGEIGSSLGRVRCVEACNVLSEENAEMFCDGQRGLDVRQAQTPSTPLKLLGTWPGQVARSRGGLWQFCCHRIANTALALSITVMQELIAESCNPSNKQPYPGQTGTAPADKSVVHVTGSEAKSREFGNTYWCTVCGGSARARKKNISPSHRTSTKILRRYRSENVQLIGNPVARV